MIINPLHQIASAQFALCDLGCERLDLVLAGRAARAVSFQKQSQRRRRDPFVAISERVVLDQRIHQRARFLRQRRERLRAEGRPPWRS